MEHAKRDVGRRLPGEVGAPRLLLGGEGCEKVLGGAGCATRLGGKRLLGEGSGKRLLGQRLADACLAAQACAVQWMQNALLGLSAQA